MNIGSEYWKMLKGYVEEVDNYELTLIMCNGDSHKIGYCEEFILIYENDKVSAIEYYGRNDDNNWQQITVDVDSIVEIIEEVKED